MVPLIVLNVTKNCIHLSLSLYLSLPTIKIPWQPHRFCQSAWGTQVMAMGQRQVQSEWGFWDMTRTLGCDDLSCKTSCHLNTKCPTCLVLKLFLPLQGYPKGTILLYCTSASMKVPEGISWFSPTICSVNSNSILPFFPSHSSFPSNL